MSELWLHVTFSVFACLLKGWLFDFQAPQVALTFQHRNLLGIYGHFAGV